MASVARKPSGSAIIRNLNAGIHGICSLISCVSCKRQVSSKIFCTTCDARFCGECMFENTKTGSCKKCNGKDTFVEGALNEQMITELIKIVNMYQTALNKEFLPISFDKVTSWEQMKKILETEDKRKSVFKFTSTPNREALLSREENFPKDITMIPQEQREEEERSISSLDQYPNQKTQQPKENDKINDLKISENLEQKEEMSNKDSEEIKNNIESYHNQGGQFENNDLIRENLIKNNLNLSCKQQVPKMIDSSCSPMKIETSCSKPENSYKAIANLLQIVCNDFVKENSPGISSCIDLEGIGKMSIDIVPYKPIPSIQHVHRLIQTESKSFNDVSAATDVKIMHDMACSSEIIMTHFAGQTEQKQGVSIDCQTEAIITRSSPSINSIPNDLYELTKPNFEFTPLDNKNNQEVCEEPKELLNEIKEKLEQDFDDELDDELDELQTIKAIPRPLSQESDARQLVNEPDVVNEDSVLLNQDFDSDIIMRDPFSMLSQQEDILPESDNEEVIAESPVHFDPDDSFL